MMLVPSMFWSFQAAGPPVGLLDLTALPLSSPTTQKWGVVQATLRRLRWLMSLLPEPSTRVRPNQLIGPAAGAAGAALARSASEKKHAMRRRRIGPTYPVDLAGSMNLYEALAQLAQAPPCLPVVGLRMRPRLVEPVEVA